MKFNPFALPLTEAAKGEPCTRDVGFGKVTGAGLVFYFGWRQLFLSRLCDGVVGECIVERGSEEKDTQETNGPSPWLAVGLCVLVCLLWSVNFLIPFSHPYDARGTFGDMFGAVNALFTGLAFAAVIYAIFLQKHEVRLLKSELAGTKRMMQEQQNLAAEQMELQSKQQFESTFFSLLRIFCDLVESIDLRSNGKVTAQEKDVFPIFWKE